MKKTLFFTFSITIILTHAHAQPPAKLKKLDTKMLYDYFPPKNLIEQNAIMPRLLLTPQQRIQAESVRQALIHTLYKLPGTKDKKNKHTAKTHRISGFYYPLSQPQRLTILTNRGFLTLKHLYPHARIQLKYCTINACHLLINGHPKTLRIGQTLTLNK